MSNTTTTTTTTTMNIKELEAQYKEAKRKLFLAQKVESQARSQVLFATELVEREEKDLLVVSDKLNALRNH
tara:strand:+ start:1069 stop:1281 length:213 start_codon:yes stop_codon:yes gene_type:complete